MHFEPEHTYHVYNRGNNKTPIFFLAKNYLYFLKKIKTEWLPYCDIYCYCLMPNHFHFMLQPNEEGCKPIVLKEKITHFTKSFKSNGQNTKFVYSSYKRPKQYNGESFSKENKSK